MIAELGSPVQSDFNHLVQIGEQNPPLQPARTVARYKQEPASHHHRFSAPAVQNGWHKFYADRYFQEAKIRTPVDDTFVTRLRGEGLEPATQLRLIEAYLLADFTEEIPYSKPTHPDVRYVPTILREVAGWQMQKEGITFSRPDDLQVLDDFLFEPLKQQQALTSYASAYHIEDLLQPLKRALGLISLVSTEPYVYKRITPVTYSQPSNGPLNYLFKGEFGTNHK